ncbi:lipopolysaccharide biosynthesis protein [Actinokineospora sp.]|uniref:lipopolysaccharide biosynthesis protein n=1 Tax=Actinokineospora sp. TaxID=1872133 RepID=UPI0040382525
MLTSTRLRRVFGPPAQMAAGLILFGIAGYVFVALTGRTLSSAEANLAIAFYFLVNVVGPGIFYALEQVTSRSVSGAVAAGRPLGSAIAQTRRGGLWLVAAVMAILLLLSPILVGATLHGDWVLFVEVLATPVIGAGVHLVRGMLGGLQRFGGYAVTLAVEGVARLVFCVALAVAGASTAWAYGAVYLAGSVVAMLVGVVLLRKGSTAPASEPVAAAAEQPHIGKGLAALATATLFAQLLPNLAPLAVTSRLAEDSAVALAFGQAAVVARIPLLLFFPIQTMLLPSLTAAVTRGEMGVVARRVRLTLAGVAGVGMLGAVIFVLLGPWVLRTFLNTAAELDTSTMAMLAFSTVVLVAAYAVQPALVALHRDQVVTLGWTIGSVVTLAIVLIPLDAVLAAAVAQIVGPALTLLIVLLGLRAGLRQATTLGGSS